MQELTYHWEGDYLIPDLEPPEAPRIGKYGTMRHKYLWDHHRGIFDGMLLEGSLNAHLEEIDRQANEMMERLTTQMAQIEGVTEQFKATNQMGWVRRMNNIHNRAEKIVFSNLIFSCICSVSCHFEAIHRREIRIIYAKRNGFLTSFEMTDEATE